MSGSDVNRFLWQWSRRTAVVLALVLVTQCGALFLRGVSRMHVHGVYLESQPAGARILVDGVEHDTLAPSRVGLSGAREIRLVSSGEIARARVARTTSMTLGTHRWRNRSRQPLDPVLDGAMWVGRRDHGMRVWFPRDGRVLCAVGLFDYGWRTFYLDEEKVPPHQWGPDTSRNFDTTLGLDLAAGRHVLRARKWRAVVVLHDRTTLYLDEADAIGRSHDTERIVLALPPDQYPEQVLVLEEGERRLVGPGPHDFETSQATLVFQDVRAREHRIELELSQGQGLWIRAGASPR